MVHAAQGLVKTQNPAIGDDEDKILAEFIRRFCDTQLFYDKYAGGKFAEYLFKAREFISQPSAAGVDRAIQLLQEAQLFIDAAHDCHNRASATVQSAVKIPDAVQPGT
jgi:sulfite reductase (ferredoxin)